MKQLHNINYQVEVQIAASKEKVWEALVEKTNEWWSSDYYTNTRTIAFHIEPILGGKMFEDFGNNEGLVWANIIGVDKPNVLQMKGDLSPDFGGPAISFVKIILTEENGITTVQYNESMMGLVNQKTADSLSSGWIKILTEGLKKYVEKGKEIKA